MIELIETDRKKYSTFFWAVLTRIFLSGLDGTGFFSDFDRSAINSRFILNSIVYR